MSGGAIAKLYVRPVRENDARVNPMVAGTTGVSSALVAWSNVALKAGSVTPDLGDEAAAE